jgi:hypothetical protein
VIDRLLDRPGLHPILQALLVERRAQGRERYGTKLRTRNGRNARADLLQEVLDAYIYAGQDLAERRTADAGRRVRLLEILVREVAEEIGVEAP